MIECSDCKRKISEDALACPYCGIIGAKRGVQQATGASVITSQEKANKAGIKLKTFLKYGKTMAKKFLFMDKN